MPKECHKTNIFCRKLLFFSQQSVPTVTWYSPSDEQSPTNKVRTWLDKHTESRELQSETDLGWIRVQLNVTSVG